MNLRLSPKICLLSDFLVLKISEHFLIENKPYDTVFTILYN